MTRPAKGTPEYELWLAAIDIAIYAPLRRSGSTYAASIPWKMVEELRRSLDVLGIDWRAAKAKG